MTKDFCNTVPELEAHQQRNHSNRFSCDQCLHSFRAIAEVEGHAWRTRHLSFACKQDGCESKFSQWVSYRRHLRKHQDDAKRFPCKYCRKYRGKNGFTRRDHLTQHIRNYHHIQSDETTRALEYNRRFCPRDECSESMPRPARWDAQPKFASSAAWMKHMRTVHEASEYSCPQPGCDRIGGMGYFRGADLSTHLRKAHGTDGSLEGIYVNQLYS